MLDKIMGVIALLLSAAAISYSILEGGNFEYERNIETAEAYKEYLESQQEQYIAPADQVLIELMEQSNER